MPSKQWLFFGFDVQARQSFVISSHRRATAANFEVVPFFGTEWRLGLGRFSGLIAPPISPRFSA